jgi:2,4-dienoyl-CoA reductase [(3E)-enoyl-CoA-producing], peroxisomal
MSVFVKGQLEGKVALVTGGATGIGLEIARTLGVFGAKVVICSRKQEVLAAAVANLKEDGIDCIYVVTDVRNPEAVENAVNQTLASYNSLDILINNAAGNFPAKIEGISYNGFKTIIDIDLNGTFNMSKAVFEAYMKDNGGAIVNITAAFELRGVSYQAHVASAKVGINSLTRTCAVEWGGLGIRTNAVAPGGIHDTEGMARFSGSVPSGTKPIPKGQKQDIANAVLFLVSEAASFINGVCLNVDGGGSVDMMKVPV